MILVDTNVVVAALVAQHDNHRDTLAIFERPREQLLLAAHSHAEAYVTLTRRGAGPSPFAWPARRAIEALASVRAATTLVGLTPAQTIEVVERYAEIGIGARIYDYLIGRTGLIAGAECIVSLNLRHMRSLFLTVEVVHPSELSARSAP